MHESATKDLRYAENLRREGNLLEALKLINDIEKKRILTPGDQLSLLISKGKIYTLLQQYPESAKIGELAYKLSKGLDRVPDTIMALIFRSNLVFYEQSEDHLDYLNEADDLLNSLSEVSPIFFSRQKANILFRKAWAYVMKGNLIKASQEAFDCMELQEKLGRNRDIAYTLELLGRISYFKNELDSATDFFSKSIKIFEEIEDPIGGAGSLSLLGRVSFNKGDLNEALAYGKKSLSTRLNIAHIKFLNYNLLADVYYMKGELDRALRYYTRASSLAEKLNFYENFINNKIVIGQIYVMKGEYELAIEILKSGLVLAKEINLLLPITNALLGLMLIFYQMDLREEFQDYLDQLNEQVEIYKGKDMMGYQMALNGYRIGKAWFLIKSGRSHNRAEAEKLLKLFVQEKPNPIFFQKAISILCEFYLEELQLFNEPEILKEVNPLIEQLLNYAKEQNIYSSLAEAKLLQAKIALIQMKFEEAQQLLTQAQRIAELYGLNYIARKISSEHDNYLEKISEWEALKEKDAPMAERLKLASVDGVIERLQGKRAIEPPEIVEETPILLLIMDESGNTFFTHSFSENWDFDDLFSSFMSAFNTFSGEIFSKSIDRIKIGENIILINPIESFLACYVIKGQSYPAQQKLSRFTDAIKKSGEIWDTLNKAVRTSEMLELNNPVSLGNLVKEIFT